MANDLERAEPDVVPITPRKLAFRSSIGARAERLLGPAVASTTEPPAPRLRRAVRASIAGRLPSTPNTYDPDAESA